MYKTIYRKYGIREYDFRMIVSETLVLLIFEEFQLLCVTYIRKNKNMLYKEMYYLFLNSHNYIFNLKKTYEGCL